MSSFWSFWNREFNTVLESPEAGNHFDYWYSGVWLMPWGVLGLPKSKKSGNVSEMAVTFVLPTFWWCLASQLVAEVPTVQNLCRKLPDTPHSSAARTSRSEGSPPKIGTFQLKCCKRCIFLSEIDQNSIKSAFWCLKYSYKASKVTSSQIMFKKIKFRKNSPEVLQNDLNLFLSSQKRFYYS